MHACEKMDISALRLMNLKLQLPRAMLLLLIVRATTLHHTARIQLLLPALESKPIRPDLVDV